MKETIKRYHTHIILYQYVHLVVDLAIKSVDFKALVLKLRLNFLKSK